jgi:hypothetical protein
MERENNLLSCDELDAVVGGMMNNGQGDRLQTPKNTGGPGGGPNWGKVGAEGVIILGIVIGLFNI